MKNELLVAMMKRDGLTRKEAISILMEEFEENDMDVEETLYNLGFEPDYCFDLIEIVSRV